MAVQRLFVALAFAGVGMLAVVGPVRAEASVSAGTEAFVSELVTLAAAGEVTGLVDRAEAVQTTCPTAESLPGNACEGKQAGAQVRGYRGGVLFGGVEFYGAEGFAAFISAQVAALGPGQLTPYTIAHGGHITDARTCDGCATAVVSTPTQAALHGGMATLLIFEIEPVDGKLVVSAVLGGTVDDLARPAIEGGQYGHLLFEPVGDASPKPPAVGTAGDRGGSRSPLALIAGIVLVAGVALAVALRVQTVRRA